MNRLFLPGRIFFAVALAAFGTGHFLVGDFIPGRAPAWPAATPGGALWAYVSGALLIAAGVALIARTRVRLAAIVAGLLIFGWALLRHIPLAAADPTIGGEWTNTGKALALAGGAFIVAGSPLQQRGDAALVAFGRIGLAAFMILAGIQHFMFAPFVMTLVPAWIPGPLFWTYFAGVALIAGGAGLLVPWTARPAAALSGLMVFLWLIMLHIPRALAAPPAQLRNEWTSVFEALAISGIGFMLAGLGARHASTARPAHD